MTSTDLGLGLVDASVVAIAERLGVTTIATMNQCDFATGVGPGWKNRHSDNDSGTPEGGSCFRC